MTRKARYREIIQETLIETMDHGTLYTLNELARWVVGEKQHVDAALATLVEKRMLRKGTAGGRCVYWLPTSEEVHLEMRGAQQVTQSQTLLHGYDATMRRFQDLCMTTRSPGRGERK